jgi:hypothetical protein
MVALNPAPDTLGFASPSLGPWFRDNSPAPPAQPVPTLPMPSGDLSVSITLPTHMQWLTPASATRSYHVAAVDRPPALRSLRNEVGAQAFADGALVVLLTLLPESELRLWALTQPIPSPDGSPSPPPNTAARPRIRYLALEVSAANIGDVESFRPDDLPSDLATEADRAAYLGLSTDGGLSNGDVPTSELLRPGTDSDVALANRTGSLAAKLWAFDYRGRPLDAGAVANWWAFLASTGVWDNLWEDGAAQTIPAATGGVLALPTAPVTAGRSVHLTNAHEGPVDATLLARLNRTGLTPVSGAGALFTAGSAPAISLTTAPNPDDAPIPRIAMLPLGNYASPATATPFAGWTGAAFPATMGRDFARLGALDIEQHTVGLTRSDPTQADNRLRVSPARDTAANPVLMTSDAVTQEAMNVLSATSSGQVMAPVMDQLWGQSVPPTNFGTDPLPDALNYEILPLAGEGSTSGGGSVADQTVLIHFEAGSLPASSWIRLWSHGLDTETGLRFRQHGGAGLADASGEAYVVLPIPDGAAAPTDPDAAPVRLSFDALVVANGLSRYFAEERFARPATAAGNKVALPTPPAVPPDVTLWIAEQGTAMARGAGRYSSGHHLVAIPTGSGTHALVDLATLDPSDMVADTLPNAVQAGDTLIVTEPAFGQTPDGDLAAGPNGSTLVQRTRDSLNEVATMGRPAPSQERRELVGLESTANIGVVGATPGRDENHEAPPIQLGHPGVPASAEIHGPGVALAGPATNQLGPLLFERSAVDMFEFLNSAGTPATPAPDPGGTSVFAAVLETTTYGVVGDVLARAFLDTNTFLPGQSWTTTKNQIESALGINIDPQIDTPTFDDDTAAAAMDRMLLKTRDGVKQFADSVHTAIGRAEDFLYVETPAIDPETADNDAIDLIGAIRARWSDRPGLRVMLCVPAKFLPNQTPKLEEVRKAGVAAALKALLADAPDRVVLFSPVAGPGRPTYLASTTVIVDDALLLSGSTHLWRRGLTFDSALSVGIFDENTTFGRPSAVRAARLQLMANALGLPVGFLPEDPEDCLVALQQLVKSGGLGRIDPTTYPPTDDPTSTADRGIWNPDGRPGSSGTSWLTFFAGLTGGAATDFNNAIR